MLCIECIECFARDLVEDADGARDDGVVHCPEPHCAPPKIRRGVIAKVNFSDLGGDSRTWST